MFRKKKKVSVGSEDEVKTSNQKASDSLADLKEKSSSNGVETQSNLQQGSKGQSKSPIDSHSSVSHSESSVEIAEDFFSWLMDPLDKDDFLR